MRETLIPAAQYVRMSTTEQEYSISNQEAAIARYADSNGFRVVKTYADPGRSGIALRRRPGLRSLIRDVINGDAGFQTVLIYDVSRWGRFQDIDEAAHYEFLCRRAGVRIIYCAETFGEEGSFPASMMKAIKRIMAGEYLRELSEKVYQGQKKVAGMGFRMGAIAGYGLRRLVVSADGHAKLLLQTGDRKAIKSDRVILVPGPAKEVAAVQEIFRLAIKGLTSTAIAAALNQARIIHDDRPWTNQSVLGILRNPKYVGDIAWGRTTQKLGDRQIPIPKERWLVKPGAYQPLVDRATFDAAQAAFHNRRTHVKSNEEVLDALRKLLKKTGYLSELTIDNARNVPTASTCRRRFGSMKATYQMLGFSPNVHWFKRGESRKKMTKLRNELVVKLREIFSDLQIIRRYQNSRPKVKFPGDLTIAIETANVVRTPNGHLRFQVHHPEANRGYTTLLCGCDPTNTRLQYFWVMPGFDSVWTERRFKHDDPWLRRGERLQHLADLCTVARRVNKRPVTGNARDTRQLQRYAVTGK